ncbi:MAG: hypothetical protein ACR2PG_07310 [Hyphomicrobiaceae bacterium]
MMTKAMPDRVFGRDGAKFILLPRSRDLVEICIAVSAIVSVVQITGEPDECQVIYGPSGKSLDVALSFIDVLRMLRGDDGGDYVNSVV